ncbi:MAG: sulfatase [Verrucomicrobiota bacterium]
MSGESENASRGTGRRAALGVLLFLAFHYAVGIWRLANQSGAMESQFSRLAIEDHRSYLIGQNLLVLVAYLLIGVAAWLIVMPLVSWMAQRLKRTPGWLDVPITFLSCSLVHGYFMFRLVHSRPYFTGDAAFGDWYYKVLDWPPEALQAGINGFVFDVLPWLAAVALLVWWWRCFERTGRVVLMALVALGLAFPLMKAIRSSAGGAASNDGQQMNVLVIGSDSLRGDRLGYMGYVPARSDGEAAAGVSPVIDEWAKKAAVFEACRTPIGSTLESGISLMTSAYPQRHGIRQMFASRGEIEEMERRVTPLAELMAREGYDTLAIGDWCAGYYEVTPLGFEEVEVSSFDSFRIYMSQAVFLAHFVVPLYFDNELGYRLFPQIRSFAQFVTPEVVTERVEERIRRQAKRGRPFFWHVFYSSNHLPFRSAEPYCRMFSDPDYDGPNRTGVDFDIDEFISGTDVENKSAALPKEEVEQIGALFDGCTRQFDDCFRRIMEALERHGLADNTIVVLTSDHGDDLYEQGVTLGHGLSFNGAGHSLHVPLVIDVPGREAQRFGQQVRTIDIAPTLAGLTGLEIPATWEGQDLTPWLDDPKQASDSPYYGETQFPFILPKVPGIERPSLPAMDELTFIDPGFNHQFVLKEEYRERVVEAKQSSLRTRDWKLVCTPTADGKRHFGLFHTATDPTCLADVAAEHPGILEVMRVALERWIDEGIETPMTGIFPDGEGAG